MVRFHFNVRASVMFSVRIRWSVSACVRAKARARLSKGLGL